jgi:LSD1 subclass zinc finger protein
VGSLEQVVQFEVRKPAAICSGCRLLLSGLGGSDRVVIRSAIRSRAKPKWVLLCADFSAACQRAGQGGSIDPAAEIQEVGSLAIEETRPRTHWHTPHVTAT